MQSARLVAAVAELGSLGIVATLMKLTKLQKKTLQYFESFSTETPTVIRQMRFNWFAWLPLLIIGVLGLLLLFTPGFECAGWLWIGLVAGAVFRDIGRFRGIVRVWPVYREIIDWQRVKELLKTDDKPDA